MDRNTTDSRKFAIIGVPSSAGARRAGQEGAPSALRAAGLFSSLQERGLDVLDRGDLPKVAFRPDPENPRRQNLDLVRIVARNVAIELERVSSDGSLPSFSAGTARSQSA
jgi:arginase